MKQVKIVKDGSEGVFFTVYVPEFDSDLSGFKA